jgi:uncharacterized phage protein (TIGR02218 family)
MKTASTTLQNFLADNATFVMADLYQFTLSGGTVLRYSGAAQLINYGGNSYPVGPRFTRSGLGQKRGVQVDSLDLEIDADERHQVNGVPLLSFIRNRGFDSALLTVTRVFAQDWSTAWVGGFTAFLGRLSEITESGATYVKLKVNSGLEVLDANMPADLYQASCLNTLFDSKCNLARAGFQSVGTVTGVASVSGFNTNLTQAGGYFSTGGLGTLLFTSGANNGVRRTIKTHVNAGGALTFVAPFPAVPAIGDQFQIWPGCDLSQSRCSNFFNNLINFRGQPYIPIPETILGGVAQQSSAQQQAGVGGGGGGVTGARVDLA